MPLFTVVIAKPHSSYIRTALFLVFFFAFLHLFVKMTWKMRKLELTFLDGEWFNSEFLSFAAVILLSALFAQFVLSSVIVIEDEEVVIAVSPAINKVVRGHN
jgi:hypothetical protein